MRLLSSRAYKDRAPSPHHLIPRSKQTAHTHIRQMLIAGGTVVFHFPVSGYPDQKPLDHWLSPSICEWEISSLVSYQGLLYFPAASLYQGQESPAETSPFLRNPLCFYSFPLGMITCSGAGGIMILVKRENKNGREEEQGKEEADRAAGGGREKAIGVRLHTCRWLLQDF